MTVYLSNRDGNGKTNEEGHYKFQTLFYDGNVATPYALQVTQNSPLGLSVLVNDGMYKIDTSSAYSYTGWLDADEVVSISTPNFSNPRIDVIVIYVDKQATTSASPPNNPGIVKIIAVNGSASASPIAPSNAAIQTAVGSGNPFVILANVRVNAGTTQITNNDITDLRQPVKLSEELLSAQILLSTVGPLLYPVGSIYTNATDSTNPSEIFGFGTWVAFGQGKVPVGLDTSDTDFGSPGKTGGSKYVTLTEPQMPVHNHPGSTSWVGDHAHYLSNILDNFGGGTRNNSLRDYPGANVRITDRWTGGAGAHNHSVATDNRGGNQPHPNMQPYVVVYMWKRTA